jgi:hypothetical protein
LPGRQGYAITTTITLTHGELKAGLVLCFHLSAGQANEAKQSQTEIYNVRGGEN